MLPLSGSEWFYWTSIRKLNTPSAPQSLKLLKHSRQVIPSPLMCDLTTSYCRVYVLFWPPLLHIHMCELVSTVELKCTWSWMVFIHLNCLHSARRAWVDLTSTVLTQPAATAALASVRSACTRPGWRCRWSPRWQTDPRSSPRSPAPGSGAGCSRTGWSGRPWGGPGRRGRHSFQPGKERDVVRRGGHGVRITLIF